MSERCETCRYWFKGVDLMTQLAVHTCRRGPPQGPSIVLWPITKHDDWCGEWRAREAQASWLEREP